MLFWSVSMSGIYIAYIQNYFKIDDAPFVNVSKELIGEIKKLIEKFSLADVRKALNVAESDI